MRGHNYRHTEQFMGISGDVIQAAGEAAGIAITAISGVQDVKLRRQFEERLALLSNQQQKELDSKLLEAKTEADRRMILASTLSSANVARIQAFNKQQSNVWLYVVGGIFVVGIGIFLYRKSAKK